MTVALTVRGTLVPSDLEAAHVLHRAFVMRHFA
jgi:hypothetical protein